LGEGKPSGGETGKKGTQFLGRMKQDNLSEYHYVGEEPPKWVAKRETQEKR